MSYKMKARLSSEPLGSAELRSGGFRNNFARPSNVNPDWDSAREKDPVLGDRVAPENMVYFADRNARRSADRVRGIYHRETADYLMAHPPSMDFRAHGHEAWAAGYMEVPDNVKDFIGRRQNQKDQVIEKVNFIRAVRGTHPDYQMRRIRRALMNDWDRPGGVPLHRALNRARGRIAGRRAESERSVQSLREVPLAHRRKKTVRLRKRSLKSARKRSQKRKRKR